MRLLHKYEKIVVTELTEQERQNLLIEGWVFEGENYFGEQIYIKEIIR
jgi:hypothetical protein